MVAYEKKFLPVAHGCCGFYVSLGESLCRRWIDSEVTKLRYRCYAQKYSVCRGLNSNYLVVE